jgi:hypothetical protein
VCIARKIGYTCYQGSTVIKRAMHTEGFGVFRIGMGEGVIDLTRHLGVVLEHRTEDTVLMARIDSVLPVNEGVTDVGRVTFTQAPLVAAGVIRDDTDAPISQRINVVVSISANPGTSDESRHLPPTAALSSAFTADGRFRVHGWSAEDNLVLRVRAASYTPGPPVPFRRGETDLEVVLSRGGQVVAHCRTPNGGTLDDILVRLVDSTRRGTSAALHPTLRSTGERGIVVTWNNVGIGFYDMLFYKSGDESHPIHSIERIEVRSATTVADDRLKEIVLGVGDK